MTSETDYERGRVFASLPRTTRGLPVVVGLSPKGDKITYTNSNSVYTVNLSDLTDVDIYTEHAVPATVAKISPSGFYCASGDNAGNVRIWDTTQSTHILKAVYQVFSGPVRDIAWNDDSKRIAAVGEGRERFGHVFLFDTGTSNGNLSGQSRPMSSIDFRPTRPFRLVSGSEDNTVAMFEGPPFKFKTTFHEHTRFVHVTRYNPDGSLFASAGADGKVVLFDGTDGTKQGELVDDSCKGAAHSGSVFGLTWSRDGQKIATASGDKSVKIWNVAQRSLEKSVILGSTVDDQQLSVAWTTDGVVSVSLAGFLNFIDPELGQVSKVVSGHNKPITSMAMSADKEHLFTSDFEGHITRWNIASGVSQRVLPQLHKSQVVGMNFLGNGSLVSTAWDDTLQISPDINVTIENVRSSSTKLPSQPLGVASSGDGSVTVVACYKNIVVFQNGKMASEMAIPYPATCSGLLLEKGLVAIGGQDSKVHIYTLSSNGSLTEKTSLVHGGPVTAVSFSPDGSHLVATDGARKVIPYSVDRDFAIVSDKEWTFHTAKVNCVSWSPNGRYLASGGLDTNIIVWDLQKSGEHPIIIKGAHAMAPVNCLSWLNDCEIVSAGQDANVKSWKINLN